MRRLTLALSAVLAIAIAVLGVLLWLRTYRPLAASRPIQPGAGLGADVEPTYGSGGKTVYIPVYRRRGLFTTTFTLANTGRFAITLQGLDAAKTGLAPVALGAGPVTLAGPRALRLDPHDTALVFVRWRLECPARLREVTSDRVRIRYRYLSLFTRTQTVVLPFAVTLRCSGGPPPIP